MTKPLTVMVFELRAMMTSVVALKTQWWLCLGCGFGFIILSRTRTALRGYLSLVSISRSMDGIMSFMTFKPRAIHSTMSLA